MSELMLIQPSEEHELAAIEFRQEHFDNGQKVINGGSMLDEISSYKGWLHHLECNSNEKTVWPGWALASVFFVVGKEDDRIVGIVDIRHDLSTPFLKEYGGHIGYDIRPTERGKGYATGTLMLALDFCRQLGLKNVMIACYSDNAASIRTIMKCGGILDKEFPYLDEKMMRTHWIGL